MATVTTAGEILLLPTALASPDTAFASAASTSTEPASLIADRARTAIYLIQAILSEASALAMSIADALSVDHVRLSIRRAVSSDCSVATSTYSSSGMPQSGSICT